MIGLMGYTFLLVLGIGLALATPFLLIGAAREGLDERETRRRRR